MQPGNRGVGEGREEGELPDLSPELGWEGREEVEGLELASPGVVRVVARHDGVVDECLMGVGVDLLSLGGCWRPS
jgi:hypothetical protein